jgi:hypothetical protein
VETTASRLRQGSQVPLRLRSRRVAARRVPPSQTLAYDAERDELYVADVGDHRSVQVLTGDRRVSSRDRPARNIGGRVRVPLRARARDRRERRRACRFRQPPRRRLETARHDAARSSCASAGTTGSSASTRRRAPCSEPSADLVPAVDD